MAMTSNINLVILPTSKVAALVKIDSQSNPKVYHFIRREIDRRSM